MARVTIRVDEDEKQRWQDAVENNREYSSVTSLIQLAVDRELKGQYGQSGDGQTSEAYDPTVSNTEIMGTLRDLQRDVNHISQDVGAVKDEVRTQRGAGGHYFNELPTSEAEAVTPEELAESFNDDVDPIDVRDGLENMDEQIGRVKTVLIDGETHYFKDV